MIDGIFRTGLWSLCEPPNAYAGLALKPPKATQQPLTTFTLRL